MKDLERLLSTIGNTALSRGYTTGSLGMFQRLSGTNQAESLFRSFDQIMEIIRICEDYDIDHPAMQSVSDLYTVLGGMKIPTIAELCADLCTNDVRLGAFAEKFAYMVYLGDREESRSALKDFSHLWIAATSGETLDTELIQTGWVFHLSEQLVFDWLGMTAYTGNFINSRGPLKKDLILHAINRVLLWLKWRGDKRKYEALTKVVYERFRRIGWISDQRENEFRSNI